MVGRGVVGILVCFDFTLCSSFVFVVLTVILPLSLFLLFRALVSRAFALLIFFDFVPIYPP